MEMPNSDAYACRRAAGTSSVHLKIGVSFLLSIMVALFVGMALRAFSGVDRAINKRIAIHRMHGN
jgi:hypothetical protein